MKTFLSRVTEYFSQNHKLSISKEEEERVTESIRAICRRVDPREARYEIQTARSDSSIQRRRRREETSMVTVAIVRRIDGGGSYISASSGSFGA